MIKTYFLFLLLILFIQVFPKNDSIITSKSANENVWHQDKTWYLWQGFSNLFVFNDSLYCTYGKNIFESYLIVRRDSVHYYQWFPVFKGSFLKILVDKDSVEAWTNESYARSFDLINWQNYPNQNNDLSWSATRWRDFSVWGLEEYGRSGVIFVKGDSLIFEEIESGIDVYSLAVDKDNIIYAGLSNNKIYLKKKEYSKWILHREFDNPGAKLRMLKFINLNEYAGSNKLYLNGNEIKDCSPSEIIYYNGCYFLSTFDQGVFISSDGYNFEAWNEELTNLNVRGIAIYQNKLFAATSNGIYFRNLPEINEESW